MNKIREKQKQQEKKMTPEEKAISLLQSRSNSEIKEELLEQGIDKEEELSVTMKKDES